jgi:hypothetical protein
MSNSPSDEPTDDDELRLGEGQSDEATVAGRLNRVTRYAAGAASTANAPKKARSGAKPVYGGADPSETLTIGRRIRLIAKQCECTELLVEGHLEATAVAQFLLVSEGGRFVGSAEVELAEIRGHFEGNLTATEKLVIHASGVVSGTARYQEIIIEAGGTIMGNSQSLAADPAPANPGKPDKA